MDECGTMKSHVPARPGYCAFASGEMETESVSQRFAISLTSARVKVIAVSARTDRAIKTKMTARLKSRGFLIGGSGPHHRREDFSVNARARVDERKTCELKSYAHLNSRLTQRIAISV